MWRWERRRRKAAEELSGIPLREFVYLDEVSVNSLLSSRLGAVAAEFTDTATTSLLASTGAALSAPVGVGKVQVGSKMQTTETQGSQVVRKAIIQSRFKELSELERDHLVTSTRTANAKPAIRSGAEFEELAKQGGIAGWLISPKKLARGELLEVEVELEAEPIYRFAAILTTFIDLFKENPQLLGDGNRAQIAEAILASRVLDKMLVGLIPLRGRAVGYGAIEYDNDDWLVKDDLLDEIPVGDRPPSKPVYVVGVAEADLFWKDIRRVLFSGARYQVMCRLGRDGLPDSWTPVKLVDVLRDVVPGLAETLGDAEGDLMTMLKGAGTEQVEPKEEEIMRTALTFYGSSIAEKHGKTCNEADLLAAELLDDAQLGAYEPIEDRRAAFERVNKFLKKNYSIELDSDEAADFRGKAIAQAESTALIAPSTPRGTAAVSAERRFLDSEIVAIYW